MVLEFHTTCAMITGDQVKAFKVFFGSKPELHDIMGNKFTWRMWFKHTNVRHKDVMMKDLTNYIAPLGPAIEDPKICQ